jgi:hypothetical protein
MNGIDPNLPSRGGREFKHSYPTLLRTKLSSLTDPATVGAC